MKLCLIISLTLFLTHESSASVYSLVNLFSNSTGGLIDLLPFKIDTLTKYFSDNSQPTESPPPPPSTLPPRQHEILNKRIKVTESLIKPDKDVKRNESRLLHRVKPSSTTSTTTQFPKLSYQEKIRLEKELKSQTNPYVNTKVKYDKDNPLVHMNTLEMIALNGYHAEAHMVVTKDGYILALHRIPHSTKTNVISHKTVLLHHGLLGDSASWIIAGKEKGLPYLLSDAGYDIWMANVRGNTYSRAHVSRPVNSFAFWNFTFHDVSQYDLPAIIDYIIDLKGPDTKINYIGHSMGTTVLFALLSTQTEYNKILRAAFALAPVAYMSDIKGPLSFLAKFSDDLEFLFKIFGEYEFLPQSKALQWIAKNMCELYKFEEIICDNIFFVICGHDPKQFNKTLLPIILGHEPAGASVKTIIHYAQEIRAQGKFQQFDYGPQKNLIYYGTLTPPEYPLEKITLPIALFSGQNDWLAGPKDVEHLHKKLPHLIDHYVVPYKEFNHLDFLWAIDAPTLVYKKLIELIKEEIVVKNPGYHANSSNCSVNTVSERDYSTDGGVLTTNTINDKFGFENETSAFDKDKYLDDEILYINVMKKEKEKAVTSIDKTYNNSMESNEPIFNYGFSYENDQNVEIEHNDPINFEI